MCAIITAWNYPDGEWEGLLPQYIEAPALLIVLPPSGYATALNGIVYYSTGNLAMAFQELWLRSVPASLSDIMSETVRNLSCQKVNLEQAA